MNDKNHIGMDVFVGQAYQVENEKHLILRCLPTLLAILLIQASFFGHPSWAAGERGQVLLGSAVFKSCALASPIITWLFFHHNIQLTLLMTIRQLKFIIPLICLGLWGVISTVWSPVPSLSFMRSSSLLLVLMSIIALHAVCQRANVYENLVAKIIIYTGGLCLFILIWGGREYPFTFVRWDGRLGGFIIPPNTLGAMAAMIAGLCVFFRSSNFWEFSARLTVFCSAISVVVWTFSRAAIISSMVALCSTFALGLVFDSVKFRRTALTRTAFLLLFLCTLVLVASIYYSDIISILSRGDRIDNLETASSRTILWNIALRQLTWVAGLLGFGYCAIGESGFVRLSSQVITDHAHNGYLQVLLGTGLVGCMFLYLFLLRLFRLVVSSWRQGAPSRKSTTFLFLFFILNNLSESSIGYQIYPQLVYLLIFASSQLSVVSELADADMNSEECKMPKGRNCNG